VNHALEMLAELPAVRHVMLITEDGVPIATSRTPASAAPPENETVVEIEEESEALNTPSLGTEDALAGLAIGLLGELGSAIGPLSWDAPRRLVLRAARGTLVMQSMKGAVLLVLLGRGLGAEEVRLSMDGTIARIERSLRSMESADAERGYDASGRRAGHQQEPPGPMPSTSEESKSDREVENTPERGEKDSPRPRH
jgi:predicted regulator of Ras-like GTPase activity (Roadblock/LC7/MglB family)